MRLNLKYSSFFLLYLLSCYWNTSGNAVDSLKTKDDVQKFLSVTLEKNMTPAIFFSADSIVFKMDSNLFGKKLDPERIRYRSNQFYKIDIDNDGRTDLIVDGAYLLVVLDKGNKYVAKIIDAGPTIEFYGYKEMIKLPDCNNAILLWHQIGLDSKAISEIDTLVYKYNGFVEYREPPLGAGVEKMYYGDNDCLIEIKKSGQMIANIRTGFMDSATLRYGVADSTEMYELWGLLNYIDWKSLNRHFHDFSVIEPETVSLHLYFEDGTDQEIKDHCYCGTFGLQSVYEKIFALQHSGNLKSWLCTPPVIDSSLIACPIAFLNEYWNGVFVRQRTTFGEDTVGQTFEYQEWCRYPDSSLITRKIISIFPDHHFIFADPAQNPNNPINKFSIGYWNQLNDSTIVLNWDGYSTINAVRNQKKYNDYFDQNIIPIPVKIEGVKLIYSAGHSKLRPVNDAARKKFVFSEVSSRF